MLNVSIYLLFGILIITCLLLVLIVLMQRPKNEGLGAAFGGGMTQDLFGAQTTNVLQKFTVYLGGIFFASCLILTILYSKSSKQRSDIQKKLAASAAVKQVTPSASASPALMSSPAPVLPDATSSSSSSTGETTSLPEVAPTAAPAAVTPEATPAVPQENVVPEVAATPAPEIPTAPPATIAPAEVAPEMQTPAPEATVAP